MAKTKAQQNAEKAAAAAAVAAAAGGQSGMHDLHACMLGCLTILFQTMVHSMGVTEVNDMSNRWYQQDKRKERGRKRERDS